MHTEGTGECWPVTAANVWVWLSLPSLFHHCFTSINSVDDINLRVVTPLNGSPRILKALDSHNDRPVLIKMKWGSISALGFKSVAYNSIKESLFVCFH